MDETPISPQGAAPADPAQNNTLMGILSYLGPLVIVSYILAKDNPFVKFHVKQGLVLLVCWAVLWILQSAMWQFYLIYNVLHLGIFILSIVGIVRVVQHKQEPLPLVGSFSKYFSI